MKTCPSITPQKPQKKSQPKQPKPSQAPKSPAVAQNVGPVESQPEPSDEPSPVALTPADLRLNPFNIAPALAAESAEIAQKSFAERDTNKFVTAAATVKIPMDALVDKAAELARLEREYNNVKKQLDGVMARLNNKAFTDKAPEAVVNGAREQAAGLQEKLNLLTQSMDALK